MTNMICHRFADSAGWLCNIFSKYLNKKLQLIIDINAGGVTAMIYISLKHNYSDGLPASRRLPSGRLSRNRRRLMRRPNRRVR